MQSASVAHDVHAVGRENEPDAGRRSASAGEAFDPVAEWFDGGGVAACSGVRHAPTRSRRLGNAFTTDC